MEQDNSKIIFKGTAEGLIIQLPEETPDGELFEQIALKVRTAHQFFRGSRLKVTYRGRLLGEDGEKELIRILIEEGGARIDSLLPDQAPPVEEKKVMPSSRMGIPDGDDASCRFVRGTVRSGTRIHHDGHVVIIGDVNPGGEVVATGNIAVMGALRGLVHAGSAGDRNAMVAAFRLVPTQLRIADMITRSPDGANESGYNPEMAFVKDEMIVVEHLGNQR